MPLLFTKYINIYDKNAVVYRWEALTLTIGQV
jgi:hypothetical protein